MRKDFERRLSQLEERYGTSEEETIMLMQWQIYGGKAREEGEDIESRLLVPDYSECPGYEKQVAEAREAAGTRNDSYKNYLTVWCHGRENCPRSCGAKDINPPVQFRVMDYSKAVKPKRGQ